MVIQRPSFLTEDVGIFSTQTVTEWSSPLSKWGLGETRRKNHMHLFWHILNKNVLQLPMGQPTFDM